MGVPKFFRWMSERYPAIFQLIAENRIPEFDCLYLDMNGIIHNCTHKDSDSPTFRMTEDQMFIAIFNYIEHLFGKIKPKQLFFMAIDGVAPRAKMNQQRSRRFRTALDAETAKERAIRQGVAMPKEDAFDSNCITPGTEFMAKLTKQLKYFIHKKISEDVDWQGVDIILSGHEVPGEGEHKIMEYIRLTKSQPDYDSNVRHCLYGLDADLIMLGLLSHDPHFCLLREEVTFGRQAQKKSKELEHQNFYLMHLCIVREYLELEFQELQEPGLLRFPFDMERVIDDFILMAFFVGNDFLPNLPNLHINEGALSLMFKVYKSVLPKANGYINERGVINLERLALLLDELSDVEYRFFEGENADARWFKGKQMAKVDVMEKGRQKFPPVLTTSQKELFRKVKAFVTGCFNDKSVRQAALNLPVDLPARDRRFIEDLADNLRLNWNTPEDGNGQRYFRLSLPRPMTISSDPDSSNDEGDEEMQQAVLRVLNRYDDAQVLDMTALKAQEQMEQQYQTKFLAWKNKYYRTKFDWDMSNTTELRKLTENYVQGLQWVLFYYYRGVASWPWFYGYHYSPMISDVKRGLRADLNFLLGQPFRPFQQLMGVLPDRSKKIVPSPYHDLMTNLDSPIIDFYPREFELDMNGKKMEWEAVVKIPFIDETRLLAAMASREMLLTQDERFRNEFGVSLKFTYSQDADFTYPSSLAGVFPDLHNCHCVMNTFDLPTLDGLDVYIGLAEGVGLGETALAGFPSLKTLPHSGLLGFHGVTVFQQESRNESMVVTLHHPTDTRTNFESVKRRLGRKVHVGYPFLQEAKVVRLSDELFDYSMPDRGPDQMLSIPHDPNDITSWRKKAERIESTYSKRFGIMIGKVEWLVHVEMLKGVKKTEDGAVTKEYGVIQGFETDYAAQVIVDEVVSEDQRFVERAALPIEEEFPPGTRGFFLGAYGYGRPMEVIAHQANKADVVISVINEREAGFGREIVEHAAKASPYTPSYVVAKMLKLNPLVLSKITSSFSVMVDDQRLNLGLNLKFEAKKLKVLGYSRRDATGWSFSQKAIRLISQYMVTFPEFIIGIQRKPQGDHYVAADFYPSDVAKTKFKEIQTWLKSVQSKNFEQAPLDAEQLDSEMVKYMENGAKICAESTPPAKEKRIRGAPRSAILKPSDAEQRLGNQRFSIGDRVVYVQDSGKVPIAAKGTVVGLTRTSRTMLLDVVFDDNFMGGSTLGDRCSPFRGSTVPISSVLNLTNRQLVVVPPGSDERRPGPAAAARKPAESARYGSSMGPAGQGQFVDAPAPSQLKVSWNEAVKKSSSTIDGGRGDKTNRGGGGRGRPFGPSEAAGPGSATDGHLRVGGGGGGVGGYSNASPGNYSMVPPPPSLDVGGSSTGGVQRGRPGPSRGRAPSRR